MHNINQDRMICKADRIVNVSFSIAHPLCAEIRYSMHLLLSKIVNCW